MVVPSGLKATEITPLLPGSARVTAGLPVATFHRYARPLPSPAARTLPSGLNAIAVMLALPKLLVQRAEAVSHRQIFSETMASVVLDGLKASAAMGTKRQAAGRPTGTSR